MTSHTAPALEFAFELNAELGPTVEIGATPYGIRRVVDILSGSFAGPLLQGELRPGGADWQIVRADGVTELHAQYILRTHDGVLIQVKVRGLRHAPANVLERIAAGDSVDPSTYYFRIAPVLEAPDGAYAWLNRSIFLGCGERQAAHVRLLIFRVL